MTTDTPAAALNRLDQMATAWLERLPDTIRTATAAQAVHDTVHTALAGGPEPALRGCLFPTCLREFDMAAHLDGKQPARPSWSGKGWKQVWPTVATGYVCPGHAPLMEQHQPRWAERADEGAVLTCACGWCSPAARWPGYAVAAWQNHLINTVHDQEA